MTGDTANASASSLAVTADLAPGADSQVRSEHEARRNRVVIRVMLVAAFIVILNETIMAVAIPPLMGVFHVSADAAQWLTAAFLLTTAVVIPVTGFLLQRFHTRPVYICAMSLFSLGTLIAALAPDLTVLIVARVTQALGTAIMMPLLMTTVMTLVPPEARGRTMGNISIVISMAPAIGPTISGFILNYLYWRWMFLLILPIALAALLFGAVRIQNVTTPRFVPLDWLSVALSALGFGGLVYGLSELGASSGSAILTPWVAMTGGAIFTGFFILRQWWLQREDRPLLDLRTFASGNFSVAVMLMAVMMMALFGMLILLPIYLQNVLGLSTLRTGLLLLPGGLIMGLLSPPVGRWYDRIGPAPLLIPGVLLVSAVLWAMTLLGTDTPVRYILAGHIVISAGFALLFTPLFTVSLSSVRMALYSHGSAVLGSVQQLAGAAGVALFVALMSARAAVLLARGIAPVQALAAGIRDAFFCGAVISLAAVVLVLFVRRPAMDGLPAA